jgi:hypothetical protein
MRKAVEDRARPILLPLIKGDSVRITPAQQELIATWATMKAMVAEWTIRGNVTTNHMQRKRMMWRQLPPERNWGVWIGRFVTDTGKLARLSNKIATYFNSPMERVRARLEALVMANAALRCGARSKRTGKPCRGAAMPNGRCKVHGGKSTGPRTPEGLERSRRANWKHGHFSREAKAERSRVRAAILALRDLRMLGR